MKLSLRTKWRLLLTVTAFICVAELNAQDIHFSQFYHNPMLLNPAKTGDGCAFRFGVNYRSQWGSVTSPYKTFATFIDFPIFINYRKTTSLGLGLSIFNDVAGDGNLTTLDIAPALALHIGFDRARKYRLSAGGQFAYRQKSIDLQKLTFQEQFNGISIDPTLPNGEYQLRGNAFHVTDFNVGVQFNAVPSDKWAVTVGYSKFHLLAPIETYYDNQLNLLNTRNVIHAHFKYYVNDKLTIAPHAVMYTQAKASGKNIGAEFNYKLNPTSASGFAIFAGPYYRIGDAVQFLVGAETSKLRVGFTYDLNVSDLNKASKTIGGYELALIYKAPCKLLPYRTKYQFACPRF
jgi:type IX secretion system PorP/SprF family membrane protein